MQSTIEQVQELRDQYYALVRHISKLEREASDLKVQKDELKTKLNKLQNSITLTGNQIPAVVAVYKGARVEELIRILGSTQELWKFINTISEISDAKELNYPWPYQGPEDHGTYKGQPVVWDGGFAWNAKERQVEYCGFKGSGGGGGEVKRVIRYDDTIEWDIGSNDLLELIGAA